MRHTMKVQRFVLATSLLIGAGVCGVAWIPVFVPGAAPYRTLIIGGGPDIEHNQVAIESNVRYLERLLPNGSPTRVLFTDGDPSSKNVLCSDSDSHTYYKKPDIPRIDGPSELSHIQSELKTIADDVESKPDAPVLLYFTGHGSPNNRDMEDNTYDLWNHKSLSVRTLAVSLEDFKRTTPITLVMVECFSGAFGNLLFKNGNPKNELADLNICGFFASVEQRPAAGCTPEVNEANYKDFTSYFLAALTGEDRLGKKVTGADYNHDGKVGMNEAFAYCLLHDDSIDTPVCTSDVFLRHFVTTENEEVMKTPYSQVHEWASPSQRAALDGLSQMLNLKGEDRLQQAYDLFANVNMETDDLHDVRIIRYVRLGKSVVLAHTLMTTGDDSVKSRFQDLLTAEAGNPLR